MAQLKNSSLLDGHSRSQVQIFVNSLRHKLEFVNPDIKTAEEGASVARHIEHFWSAASKSHDLFSTVGEMKRGNPELYQSLTKLVKRAKNIGISL